MGLLEQRKKGILPQIDIAGHRYTVDIRLNELRNSDFPNKRLGLDEMVTSPDGRHYLFFYNREIKSILHASVDMVEVPEKAVLVEIPDELGLDPVGMARKYGLRDEYFLKMHPYKEGLMARITSIEKSGLPEYVAANQNLEGQPQQGMKSRKL